MNLAVRQQVELDLPKIKLHTSNLKAIKDRIDLQEDKINEMKSDLARLTEARKTVKDVRASEARPENEGVDQVTPKPEEGLSTAQN